MSKNIEDYILEAINVAVENHINRLKKDTSLCVKKTAIVTAVLSNKQYKLKIDDHEYQAKSNNSYQVGNIVTIISRYGSNYQDIYILP